MRLEFLNLLDQKTTNNKITKSQALLGVDGMSFHDLDKIIAVGRQVSDALRERGIEHHEIPHPSGLNRKLNDRNYVNGMIGELKKYLTQSTERN